MKKILTTFSLLLASVYVSGQSLRLFDGATDISNTTLTVPITAGANQVNNIDVHNINSSSVNFKIRRIIMTPPLDATCNVYFCSGIHCYPPSPKVVYTEPGTGTTLAGMTNLTGASGLIAHFDVGATSCCDTYIKYQAYNTNVIGDTATVIVHYSCVSAVNEVEKLGGAITSAYPNPSNSLICIKYNIKENSTRGKIVFYDLLGKVEKEVVLNDKEGTAKINVSDFNEGIYFYSFFIDDKLIATKKLVIPSK